MELEFDGEVFWWKGPAPFHFVTVPEPGAGELRAASPLVSYGWGVIPVAVVIGRTRWTTSLFPRKGAYLVPLRDAVRTAEGITLGDVVSVRLTVDVERAGRR